MQKYHGFLFPPIKYNQMFFTHPKDYEKLLCIAEISDWPVTSRFPYGNIRRELINSGNLATETDAMLAEYSIDDNNFSQSAMNSLPVGESFGEWTIPEDEIKSRKDFRDTLMFTIDPKTARDLDDALHLRRTGTGYVEVGVHIADVTYFLKENSSLDKVASERGTSVYLVNKVVPMLPQLLSEELCSLKPGVDRLAVSVVYTIDPCLVKVISTWIGRTVIRSVCQLSYEVAQGLIDDQFEECNSTNLPSIICLSGSPQYTHKDLSFVIKQLHRFAQIFRKRRLENGALSLNKQKIHFNIDSETGLPNGCSCYEIRDSNRLIEEFMLMANATVAQNIYMKFPHIALLRRHSPPKRSRSRDLAKFCGSFGFPMNFSSSKTLQANLNDYSELPEYDVIQQFCIKIMQMAEYFCTGSVLTEDDFRHYGLCMPFYTHFTSPIRRYPDIIVHRLLNASLNYCDKPQLTEREINLHANHCNERKLAAKKVDDASKEMFFALFIKECGPIQVIGMISNVLDHAFDVYIKRYGVVKRIYCESLDLYDYDIYYYGSQKALILQWSKNRSDTTTIITFALVKVVLTNFAGHLQYNAYIEKQMDDELHWDMDQ